jgi:hypothetical protein
MVSHLTDGEAGQAFPIEHCLGGSENSVPGHVYFVHLRAYFVNNLAATGWKLGECPARLLSSGMYARPRAPPPIADIFRVMRSGE